MSDYADPERYEEVMGALQTFITRVSEACDTMEAAGITCVDSMDGDPSAEKANASLHACTQVIRDAAFKAQEIITKLQAELEDINDIIIEDF